MDSLDIIAQLAAEIEDLRNEIEELQTASQARVLDPLELENSVPYGTGDGEIIYWDDTDKTWKVTSAPSDGSIPYYVAASKSIQWVTPSAGTPQVLVWNGSGYTFVSADHDYQVLQKTTGGIDFDWVRAGPAS